MQNHQTKSYFELVDELERNTRPSPLQQAVIDYLCCPQSDFNLAATLTFRTNIRDRINAESIGLRFQQFHNNNLGFPNWKRKWRHDSTQRAPMIMVLEGDGDYTPFHYHALLSKPSGISEQRFVRNVTTSWSKATSTRTNNVFKPIYDLGGWMEYVTKEISSTSTDCIHWDATHTFTNRTLRSERRR
jgi:hypothetical protein